MKISYRSGKLRLQAAKGCLLPVFYRGKIVRVGETEPVEFEVSELDYQSKIHIVDALKLGHVVEAKASADADSESKSGDKK